MTSIRTPHQVITPPDIAGRRDREPDRGSYGQLPRFLSVPPWDLQPIPTAKNFESGMFAPLVLAAGPGQTTVTTVALGGAFQIPVNNVGVIALWTIFVDAPTTLAQIVWTFRANQSPIPGLEAITFTPRSLANFEFLETGSWDVPDGSFLDVLITNKGAGGPWNVSAKINGWYAPSQDIRKYTGMSPGQLF